MKQADIVVGTEYVWLSYGDYNPTVDPRHSWRGAGVHRVRVLQPPSGGKVVVEFVDHPGEDKRQKVATRELKLTWAEHEVTMANLLAHRTRIRNEAAEVRRSRAETSVHAEHALEALGEPLVETGIALSYKVEPEVVMQELADLGFNVYLATRFGDEDEIDSAFKDITAASSQYYQPVIHVVSAADIAGYAAGLRDEIKIDPATLVAAGALV